MAKRLFHKALASALILCIPGSARPQVPDKPHAQQLKPSDPFAKSESSLSKAKKIWTNDNLSSAPGQVSIVGAQSSRAEHGSRSTSSFSNGATFLTPADGQMVHPGEIVHFDLSIALGRSTGPVGLISPLGVSSELRESAPYCFTLETPSAEGLGGGNRLIEIQPVTAFGKVQRKGECDPGAIEVVVEGSEMSARLLVTGNLMGQYGPPGLRFFDAGSEQWLAIIGTFPNGDVLDLVNSSDLKLTSSNPKVARVAEEGMLTSLGPGNTSITAPYTLGAQTTQISAPASVTIPNSGLIATPLPSDFGDQQAGTASNPLEVTLTNHSLGTITIYKFIIRAAAKVSDNCTSAPAPPDGTCISSVAFAPFRAAPSRGLIYIPNSFSGLLSLPISGNGI